LACDGAAEKRRAKTAPAVSNKGVAAAAKRRAGNNGIPFPEKLNFIAKALA
jgi:hypothetical protein